MPRVAFVIPDLIGNGAERSTLRLAGALIERGYAVDLVLFRPRIHFDREFPAAARLFVWNGEPDAMTIRMASDILKRRISLPVKDRRSLPLRGWVKLVAALKGHPLALKPDKLFLRTLVIAEYIRTERPDCILPALPKAKTATLLAKSLVPDCPPIIPIVHSVLENRRSWERVRYRCLMGRGEHVVAVSEGVRRSISANTGLPLDKITAIYNPAVIPDMHPLRREAPPHPWFSDGGPPIVLAAGRLARVKDHATLVKAFRRLVDRRPVRLVILGEGRRRRSLLRLIDDLNLQDSVSLPGWTDNVYAFMSRASLFVLSSRWEGLGNVLIEALACGCPCVSTDCPSGPAEILEGGRIGPLVPVGDVGALAEAMHRTLDDPPETPSLTGRAAFFSIDRSADAYDALIAETVRRRGAAASDPPPPPPPPRMPAA